MTKSRPAYYDGDMPSLIRHINSRLRNGEDEIVVELRGNHSPTSVMSEITKPGAVQTICPVSVSVSTGRLMIRRGQTSYTSAADTLDNVYTVRPRPGLPANLLRH